MNNFDIEIVANTNNYPIPYISIIDQPQNVNHEHIEHSQELLQDLNYAISESLIINIIFSLIASTKIGTTLFLFTEVNEICNGPLGIWLYSMLIYDFIYLISCLQIIIFIFLTNNRESLAALNNSLDGSFQNYDLTFHAHARRRISRRSLQLNGFDISNNIERTHKCAGFIMELSRFIYLLLFLFGNVILFSDDQCPRVYWYIMLSYLIMGYIYFMIPLVLFILICLYMPFGLLTLYCFPTERVSERKRFIQSLISEKYNLNEFIDCPTGCCICMIDFLEKDKVISMPCNKLHLFHEKCIKTWLLRNGVCPICRKDFANSFSFDN